MLVFVITGCNVLENSIRYDFRNLLILTVRKSIMKAMFVQFLLFSDLCAFNADIFQETVNFSKPCHDYTFLKAYSPRKLTVSVWKGLEHWIKL